jgi:hypothetical protein
MKRFLLIFFFTIFFATPAYSIIVYCDPVSGDDTNGTGSAANPYKTIYKCTTGLTGGDECRVAATPPTQLPGTLTFTDGSTTVNTSEDLSSILATDNMIGKFTDDDPHWYEILTVGSSSITLIDQYAGTTETVTGYLMAGADKGSPAQTGSVVSLNGEGTSATSRLKISGGWNLATERQDGKTHIFTSGSLRYGDIDINLNEYFWFDNIDFARFYRVHHGTSPSDAKCIDALPNKFTRMGFHYMGTSALMDSAELVDTIVATGSGLTFQSCQKAKNLYVRAHDAAGTALDFIPLSSPDCSEMEVENIYLKDVYSAFDVSWGFTMIRNAYITTATYLHNGSNLATSRTAFVGENFYLKDVTNILYVTTGAAIYKIYNIFFDNAPSSNWTWSTYKPNLFFKAEFIGVNGEKDKQITISGHGNIITKQQSSDRGGYEYVMSSFNTMAENTAGKANMKPYRVGRYWLQSKAFDVEASLWIKDDASFNGYVQLMAVNGNQIVAGPTDITPTTSFVKESITIDSTDLTKNDYLDLYILYNASTGTLTYDTVEFTTARPY